MRDLKEKDIKYYAAYYGGDEGFYFDSKKNRDNKMEKISKNYGKHNNNYLELEQAYGFKTFQEAKDYLSLMIMCNLELEQESLEDLKLMNESHLK